MMAMGAVCARVPAVPSTFSGRFPEGVTLLVAVIVRIEEPVLPGPSVKVGGLNENVIPGGSGPEEPLGLAPATLSDSVPVSPRKSSLETRYVALPPFSMDGARLGGGKATKLKSGFGVKQAGV